MYAHVLRKWSLAKYLIIQWLPVLMLLVLYWCHGAAGLHLPLSSMPTSLMHDTVTPSTAAVINNHQRHNNDNDYFDRLGTIKLTNINNNNNEQKYFQNYRNFNFDNTILTNRQFIPRKFSNHFKLNYENQLKMGKYNKLSSSQPSSVSLVRLMRSRNSNDHINKRNNNNDDNKNKKEINERFQRSLPLLLVNEHNQHSIQEQPITTITTKVTTKIEPIWQSLWTEQRLNEKRARLTAHRYQLELQQQQQHFLHQNNMNNATTNVTNLRHRLAMNHQLKSLSPHYSSFQNTMLNGRNRRESRHNMIARHLHQSNLPRINKRRFCSARDPTTLAFEAPTVFEGKVRSMSSDRRRNFSVTFEVKEVYKRQLGYKLPLLLRLQFSYRNNSECDIYKETMRSRGFIRDELEQGKVYILFVEQIDLGNYTILGQPIKKTKKVVNEVKMGVSEKYGEFD